MQEHSYDSTTGEYVGSGPAFESPLEPGEYLVSANATILPLPPAKAGSARVFNGASWGYVPDFRGKTVYFVDGTTAVIDSLGQLPPGALLTPHPRTKEVVAHLRESAKAFVDHEAGRARSAMTSSGFGIEEEYRIAAEEATRWTRSGSPVTEVPLSVQIWAEARAISAERAAADIMRAAREWNESIMKIRAIRLQAKAAIDGAADSSDFSAIATQFTSQFPS